MQVLQYRITVKKTIKQNIMRNENMYESQRRRSCKKAVRRGINISDCKKGIVNIGDKVFDKDGEECWISGWFDGIVEVDYRNEKWSVKGQYYTVYLD